MTPEGSEVQAPNRPPIVLTAKTLDASVKFPNEQGKIEHYDRIERWWAEAKRRFGADRVKWAFRCHHCKTDYTAGDARVAGMPANQVGFSCIGPYVALDRKVANNHPVKRCTYDGRNKFPHNPVTIAMPGGITARMLSFAGD